MEAQAERHLEALTGDGEGMGRRWRVEEAKLRVERQPTAMARARVGEV